MTGRSIGNVFYCNYSEQPGIRLNNYKKRLINNKGSIPKAAFAMKFNHQSAFTLMELIMVMVIVSILAVIAYPKLSSTASYAAFGFRKQLLADIHYLQKLAVSSDCAIQIKINATTNQYSAFYPAATNLATNTCGTSTTYSVVVPKLNSGTYSAVSPPANITFSSNNTFLFDSLGRADTTQSITFNGKTVNVTAGSGYVY